MVIATEPGTSYDAHDIEMKIRNRFVFFADTRSLKVSKTYNVQKHF